MTASLAMVAMTDRMAPAEEQGPSVAALATGVRPRRILVADDHALVREAVASFLSSQGLGEVLTAADLGEALARVEASGRFDLVLLDYDMPGMSGLEGLSRMIRANEGRPVALMSGTVPADIVPQAIRSGASGFVPKTMNSRSMAAAALMMLAGDVFVPYGFLPRTSAAKADLTSREAQILQCLCAGKSNKDIGFDLSIGEATVKFHVKSLIRKLGARNRTHAAMIGRDLGLA